MKELKYIVLFGNAIYILWILYNAIDEGFHDVGSIQGIVPLGLVFLLILNSVFLMKSREF